MTRANPLHTACVLWSEKTTVCRIFSCKRTRVRSCRPAPVEDRFRGQPLSKLVARSTPAPPLQARSVSLAGTSDCYIARTEVQAEAAIRFRTLPQARALRGPPPPFRDYGGRPSMTSPAASAAWLASRSPLTRQLRRRRLVENTGLEPVTSWLQTRRSPS